MDNLWIKGKKNNKNNPSKVEYFPRVLKKFVLLWFSLCKPFPISLTPILPPLEFEVENNSLESNPAHLRSEI